MKSDWLIGATAFLPVLALLMPERAHVPAFLCACVCGFAWMIRNFNEL